MSQFQAPKLATSYAAILGQIIRQLRERDGCAQEELAKHMGVSVMTVSRIEGGETILDVPQMERVADFFNINPVDFFKNSLAIKQKVEEENCMVFSNKKDINNDAGFALLSIAAIAGIIALVLFSKK